MRRQQSFNVNSFACVKASLYWVAKGTGKDARGKIVGTTEEWLSRDDITVALYLRSTQYYVLLQQYTRPVNHYP